ncbi:hypothetical protein [Candidatus Avelusimicrobium sp.]|uniref:hypothetical protein n=1 Tax=Candidatus Avelusimicrobium sp. TaxID=3048833 RepID=UPI003F7D42AF
MLNTKKEFTTAAGESGEKFSHHDKASTSIVVSKKIFDLGKDERETLAIEGNQWIEIIVEEYLRNKQLEREK